MKINVNLALSVLLCFFVIGCFPKPYNTILPRIESQNVWSIEEDCVDRHCHHKKDRLVNEEFEIDIHADQHIVFQDDIFLIKVLIWTKSIYRITFNPSEVFVKLDSGKILYARGFTCAYTTHSHTTYLSDDDLLDTPQEITWRPKIGNYLDEYKYSCFNLYFDSQPPSIDDGFELTINGITQNGNRVPIPKIMYSAGKRIP